MNYNFWQSIIYDFENHFEIGIFTGDTYIIFSIFILLMLLMLVFIRSENTNERIMQAALQGYMFIVYSMAVILHYKRFERKVNFQLFLSYKRAIEYGNKYLFYLGIENVLAFVPIGILILILLKREKKFSSVLLTTVLSGAFSLLIEVVQYIFVVGVFDVDDLFHNTLGGFLGALLAFVVFRIRNKIKAESS